MVHYQLLRTLLSASLVVELGLEVLDSSDRTNAIEPAPSAVGSERYRSLLKLSGLPVGVNQALVYSPLTNSSRVLEHRDARVLEGCRNFATLDEHAEALAVELDTSPSAIRQHLSAFLASGLLVSHTALVDLCRSAGGLPQEAGSLLHSPPAG